MILRAVQVKCIVEFFHIVQSAFCGIVGNVISPAADGLNVAEKIRTSLIQGIAYGNGAVDIEQEKLFYLSDEPALRHRCKCASGQKYP